MGEIEQGIPIPKTKRERGREAIWSKMGIGDSLLMAYTASSHANTWARRSGLDWKFTCRRDEEATRLSGQTMYRVWRTA